MGRAADRRPSRSRAGPAGRRGPVSQGRFRPRAGDGRQARPGRMGARGRASTRRGRPAARGPLPVPVGPGDAVDADGSHSGRRGAGGPRIPLLREGLLPPRQAPGASARRRRGLRRLRVRLGRRRPRDRVRHERRARRHDARPRLRGPRRGRRAQRVGHDPAEPDDADEEQRVRHRSEERADRGGTGARAVRRPFRRGRPSVDARPGIQVGRADVAPLGLLAVRRDRRRHRRQRDPGSSPPPGHGPDPPLRLGGR